MKKLLSIALILFLSTYLVGCANKTVVQLIVPPVKISTNVDKTVINASLIQKQSAVVSSAPKVESKQVVATPTGNKTVFLTFDDGPCIGTLPLLDILDKYNVKATFFVTGMHYPSVKGLYAEIKKRGHIIGLHSMSHNYAKVYTSVDGFFNDFKQIDDIVYAETGDRPKIMRFPGGSTNHTSWKYGGKTFMKESLIPEVIKRGYVYFDWNSCPNDAIAINPTKDLILQSVFIGTENKKNIVVLLHDSNYKWTMDALPEIIERFQSQGYAFGTLSTVSFRSQFTQ